MEQMLNGYTEDTFVQKTTVVYPEQQIGWQAMHAHNTEGFGLESLLGDDADREMTV
jgi:type I restriction enzyme R subunit